MLKIYKNKDFQKWAQKEGVDDKTLHQIALEANNEQYEANLGGGIYKKRVALRNKGKRDGARSIIALKKDERLFFIYAFSKNKKDNITKKEEQALKALADFLFGLQQAALNQLVKEQKLFLVEV